MRIYADRINKGDINIFTCQIDKSLSKKESYKQYKMAIDRIAEWQEIKDIKGTLKDAVIDKLAHDLKCHKLYNQIKHNGKLYPEYAHNPIEHPL